MLILTWKVQALATGKRPSRKKSTDARLCHLLHYSIPARLYFLTNVTRLINRVYFYQFFVRASHSVYISDAEFDAYYTGVKIDRFNVKIQLFKNRTLIPLIVHVQLIKILFCLIEAQRFFFYVKQI